MSEQRPVGQAASHADGCQLMCGVEKDSLAATIRWLGDAALVEGAVVVEGAQVRGLMMVSSCYRYQLSHTGGEIWKDEVREVPGKRGVTPSLIVTGTAVFGHLQAFGVVI